MGQLYTPSLSGVQAENTPYTYFHLGDGFGNCAGLQIPRSTPGQEDELGKGHKGSVQVGPETTLLSAEALFIECVQYHVEDVLRVW